MDKRALDLSQLRATGIISNLEDIEVVKQRICDDGTQSRFAKLWTNVKKGAEAYLPATGLSVTQNRRLPPSQDRHDYMSTATYWWPNPHALDGLPYVRRDGEINPEFAESDAGRIKKLARMVQYLAIAGFVSSERAYGDKAAELVRHWFIDAGSRMNPHLLYAQHVPGVNDGRSLGIIDFKPVREILNAICLLSREAWPDRDDARLRQWMAAYLDWLVTSEFGREECARPNNHGTWYDAQTLSVALYVGDDDMAQTICQRAKQRIHEQFTAVGEQPQELARSRPITYCLMNLQGFFDIASMAEKIGVDLWHHESGQGMSLEKGIKWLVPYITSEKEYRKADIMVPKPNNYVCVLSRALNKYPGSETVGLEQIVRLNASNVSGLFFPLEADLRG
jgi:hypothetical protein